jgi:glutamine synthetase
VEITRGIEARDHYWLTRYIVKKVEEYYGVDMDFQPKPVKGDWNGSGCNINFLTNSTREE